MEKRSRSRGFGFAQHPLPWIIGAVMFVFYLATMARWITFSGTAHLARVEGWTWQPTFTAPLDFLITYPIHFFPETWRLGALNVMAALFAALTLVLLARSVALLPHDQTRGQRMLEPSRHALLSVKTAWIPPIVAALVCGLQLTFWEHATVYTGEMLNLLLFAYIVRCLLEYRIAKRESEDEEVDAGEAWLYTVAFVYGVAVTNNSAMIGFFPVALVAIVWMKGLSFFRKRFLGIMTLCGIAGLLLYLLLPAWQVISGQAMDTFWGILKFNLVAQKDMLLGFPRYLLLFISVTSLLPVLFIGMKFKWPTAFGEISIPSITLTGLMNHAIHALFLAACVYAAFDLQFSPRKFVGASPVYPLLPFYFLGALSVGYFTGYFLLVFGRGRRRMKMQPSAAWQFMARMVLAIIFVGSVAVPAALLWRNSPEVRLTLNRYLEHFGQQARAALTELAPDGAVVLSDDPYRLHALQAAFLGDQQRARYLLLDTRSLRRAEYHEWLANRYGARWPLLDTNVLARKELDDVTLLGLVRNLGQSNKLYYLHPTFGYYLEVFEHRPRKLVYEMRQLPTNVLGGPVLSPEEIQLNDSFWKAELAGPLKSLQEAASKQKDFDVRNMALDMAGMLFTRPLNYLGVELQKAGELKKAAEYFEAAIAVYPHNPVAYINRDYNAKLQKGEREGLAPNGEITRMLRPYGGNWNSILRVNGPVDEPNTSYLLALALARGNNLRQAAQMLQRVVHFDPSNPNGWIALIGMCNQSGLHTVALDRIAQARAATNVLQMTLDLQMELLKAEAMALIGLGRYDEAEQKLQAALQAHPDRGEPYAALVEVYLARQQKDRAYAILEEQMRRLPKDAAARINYARLKMLDEDYRNAIPYLDEALRLQPNNTFAMLNRAICYLKIENLDAAQADYEALITLMPNPTYAVYYGLHEIAWKRNQTEEALKWGRKYLEVAPYNLPERRVIADRVNQLKAQMI